MIVKELNINIKTFILCCQFCLLLLQFCFRKIAGFDFPHFSTFLFFVHSSKKNATQRKRLLKRLKQVLKSHFG
jgi:hypothetical protein